MVNKRLSFWAPEHVMSEISARGTDISDTIRECLSRYYVLLEIGRREIRGVFADSELGLLLDLANSTRFESHTFLGGLLADCEDAEDEYFEKWKCQRQPLLVKLQKLTTCQEAALVDAAERWWERVGEANEGRQPDIGELLR